MLASGIGWQGGTHCSQGVWLPFRDQHGNACNIDLCQLQGECCPTCGLSSCSPPPSRRRSASAPSTSETLFATGPPSCGSASPSWPPRSASSVTTPAAASAASCCPSAASACAASDSSSELSHALIHPAMLKWPSVGRCSWQFENHFLEQVSGPAKVTRSEHSFLRLCPT
jgi:hypothetical protein